MGLILGGDTGNLLGTDFNHSSLLRLALTHLLSGVCPTDKMGKPSKCAQKICGTAFFVNGCLQSENSYKKKNISHEKI